MTVRFKHSNNIAHIVFARPKAANALNEDMVRDFHDAVKKVGKSSSRAVVVSGEGAHFCGGADLRWLKNARANGARKLAEALLDFWRLPMPSIAAVHGACYGGGAGIVAAADIVVAAPSAKFCFSETKLGLVPAIISPYMIRAIGVRRAARYASTAETFDAKKAVEMSLVDEIDDDENAKAEELAMIIASRAPKAVRAVKKLMREMTSREITPATAKLCATLLAKTSAGKEAQAGIAAFLCEFDELPADCQLRELLLNDVFMTAPTKLSAAEILNMKQPAFLKKTKYKPLLKKKELEVMLHDLCQAGYLTADSSRPPSYRVNKQTPRYSAKREYLETVFVRPPWDV